MFSFVFWEVLFQIHRKLLWENQNYVIISKKNVVIFNAFFIRKLFIIGFISNIIYFVYTVWDFISNSNFSIFIPDTISFWRDIIGPPNNCFNKTVPFLTLTKRLLMLTFTHIFFYRFIMQNTFHIIQYKYRTILKFSDVFVCLLLHMLQ